MDTYVNVIVLSLCITVLQIIFEEKKLENLQANQYCSVILVLIVKKDLL